MGFLLGLSLIVAIGAQNAFVLRQGIIGKHVFYVALFCGISDSLLILIGVSSASIFLNRFINDFSYILFGLASIWLFGYGLLRLKSSFRANTSFKLDYSEARSLKSTISVLAILTFSNPHVYLDTVILLGTLSQQFVGVAKITFALGAIVASFVFFFSLAYSAKLLAPKMTSALSWRILDLLIALIMFSMSIKMAFEGNWL
jgi:L-lysine exporter family protein LysE/ArgO